MKGHEALQAVLKEYPQLKEYERDLARAMETEIHEITKGDLRKYPETWPVIVDRFLEWIRTTDEYKGVKMTPLSIARFVSSHRAACVWAVLMGRAIR